MLCVKKSFVYNLVIRYQDGKIFLTRRIFDFRELSLMSTPGPIIVNLATYIGNSRGGFWGAVIATVAVVLPAFLIVLTGSIIIFKKFRKKNLSPIAIIMISALLGILLY